MQPLLAFALLPAIAAQTAAQTAVQTAAPTPVQTPARTQSAQGGEPPALLAPHDPATPLGAAIIDHRMAEGLAATLACIRKAGEALPADRMLPPVASLFARPFSLPEVANALVSPAFSPRPGYALSATINGALGLPPPPAEGEGTLTITTGMQGIFALDFLLRECDRRTRESLGELVKDPDLAAKAIKFLEIAEQSPMPSVEDSATGNELAAAAMKIDWAALAHAVEHLDTEFKIEADWSSFKPKELPEELKGAVTGDVLAFDNLEGIGWVVVGGPGPNRYDMSRVKAVLDVGGDDVYEWHGMVTGSRVIIDAAGNDRYLADGPVGPGGGLLGLSFIRDLAGDDRYEGALLSCGAGCFGAGVIIDDAGNDRYTARAWSEGAGFFGIGALYDRAGHDEYEGRVLCQGVGGPHGVGVLIDREGNDVYRVSGAGSIYATPATSRGFSQGVGYGMRRRREGESNLFLALPGGIGMLIDLAGDDRYESGEFSQGGGYFYSLGILLDHAGDDLYHGDRYAQGFAAHQAFGALIDDAGDDTYYSRTAAGQGAAWDESAAVLVDRMGNDSYQADGLSQGSAAQQAIGMLVDLGGVDRFVGKGASVQGAGGSNEYHFKETAALSFSVLLHLGGMHANYSSGRASGAVTATGEGEPGPTCTRHGLCIDR